MVLLVTSVTREVEMIPLKIDQEALRSFESGRCGLCSPHGEDSVVEALYVQVFQSEIYG